MSDSVMALRLELAAEGWASEDRLTRDGWSDGFGYSIWFRRYDWHGLSTHTLTGNCAIYHWHVSDPTRALEAVTKAAEIARRAWAEFPQGPPALGVRGELTPGRQFGSGLPVPTPPATPHTESDPR
jgi:hypothetical protein